MKQAKYKIGQKVLADCEGSRIWCTMATVAETFTSCNGETLYGCVCDVSKARIIIKEKDVFLRPEDKYAGKRTVWALRGFFLHSIRPVPALIDRIMEYEFYEDVPEPVYRVLLPSKKSKKWGLYNAHELFCNKNMLRQ